MDRYSISCSVPESIALMSCQYFFHIFLHLINGMEELP
jgi:hypothetical protein